MSLFSKLLGQGQAASAATSATRSVAKERLSVILSAQRGSELLEGVNMENLQRDVLAVVEVSFVVVFHTYARQLNDFYNDVVLNRSLIDLTIFL